MAKTNPKVLARERRKLHTQKIRRYSSGRARLCVFRSASHIYAQIIDDAAGHTLVSASTLSPELRSMEGSRGNISAARQVGTLLAEKAKAAGVVQVVFDRNGFLYHGRVKALADAAREAGLDF